MSVTVGDFIAAATVIVAWLDLRNKRSEQHQQNLVRLALIEQQLQPIADWFNDMKTRRKKREECNS